MSQWWKEALKISPRVVGSQFSAPASTGIQEKWRFWCISRPIDRLLTSTPWLQKHKSRSGDDDGFKITLALLGVECDGNPKKTRFHQVIRGLLAFQRKQNGNNGSIAETLAGSAGTR